MSGATLGDDDGALWSGSEGTDFTEGYASLERAKAYLQVDASDLSVDDSTEDSDGLTDWDHLILALQRRAKALIHQFTRRDFAHHQNKTVYLDGGQGSQTVIRLPHPVLEVHEVREDDHLLTEGDEYEYKRAGSLVRTGSTGSRAYGSSTRVGMVTSSSPRWSGGINNIEVIMDYGYIDAPEEVKEAEVAMVDHALVGLIQKRESPVVQVDNFEVEANIPITLNSEVKTLLRPYIITGVGN